MTEEQLQSDRANASGAALASVLSDRRRQAVLRLVQLRSDADIDPIRLAAALHAAAGNLVLDEAAPAAVLAVELAGGLEVLGNGSKLGPREHEVLDAVLQWLQAVYAAPSSPGDAPQRPATPKPQAETYPVAAAVHIPMQLLDRIRLWRRMPLLCTHPLNLLGVAVKAPVAISVGGPKMSIEGELEASPSMDTAGPARFERSRFQQCLLPWLRSRDPAALERIHQIIARVGALAAPSASRWQGNPFARGHFWALAELWLAQVVVPGRESVPMVDTVLRVLDGELLAMASISDYFARQTPARALHLVLACIERAEWSQEPLDQIRECYGLGLRFSSVPLPDTAPMQVLTITRHELAALRRACERGTLQPGRVDELADVLLLLGRLDLWWQLHELRTRGDPASAVDVDAVAGWIHALEGLLIGAPRADESATRPGPQAVSSSMYRTDQTCDRALQDPMAYPSPIERLRTQLRSHLFAAPVRLELRLTDAGSSPSWLTVAEAAIEALGRSVSYRRAHRPAGALAVDLHIEEHAGGVRISLRYQGCGYTAETLDRIERVVAEHQGLVLHPDRPVRAAEPDWQELLLLLPALPQPHDLLPVMSAGRWLELRIQGIELQAVAGVPIDCAPLAVSGEKRSAQDASALIRCERQGLSCRWWVERVGSLHRDMVWPLSLPLTGARGLLGVCLSEDGPRPVVDLALAAGAGTLFSTPGAGAPVSTAPLQQRVGQGPLFEGWFDSSQLA